MKQYHYISTILSDRKFFFIQLKFIGYFLFAENYLLFWKYHCEQQLQEPNTFAASILMEEEKQ